MQLRIINYNKSYFQIILITLYPLAITFFTEQSVIPVITEEPQASLPPKIERPQGKIISKFMESSFAQNWFFKNEEMEGDNGTKSIKVDVKADFQAFVPPAQEFGPRTQEELEPKKLEPKGFLQVLEDEERKRTKREQQEINFILPQNF